MKEHKINQAMKINEARSEKVKKKKLVCQGSVTNCAFCTFFYIEGCHIFLLIYEPDKFLSYRFLHMNGIDFYIWMACSE